MESYENILYALSENGPVVDPVFYGMELTLMPGANTQSDTDSHWLDANPHIYMSVSQAAAITERIAEFLCVWDAEHEEVYRKNLENAKNHLDSLRNTLSGQLEEAEIPPVIIMNEALVYFVQDYDLDIAMCYERESGEDFTGTELEMCIAALKNSGGKYILLEKQAPQSLCKSLTNAGFVPVKMDVMSTRRAQEGFEGYCKAMQENVQTLLEALKTA